MRAMSGKVTSGKSIAHLPGIGKVGNLAVPKLDLGVREKDRPVSGKGRLWPPLAAFGFIPFAP